MYLQVIHAWSEQGNQGGHRFRILCCDPYQYLSHDPFTEAEAEALGLSACYVLADINATAGGCVNIMHGQSHA